MKMKKEHYDYIKNKINQGLVKNKVLTVELYTSQGLTKKRYIWDMLTFFVGYKYVCEILYQYLNDEHINTALKNIIKEV